MTIVSISGTTRGEVIAEGELGQSVIQFEGYYYFDPDRVQMDHLVVTDRVYVCPYKGQAFWLDLETANGTIRDVAWVYHNPKPGYTQIKDRIGFYDGKRAGTIAMQHEEAG
jgi:uncharacterized protein (DUF427 family)